MTLSQTAPTGRWRLKVLLALFAALTVTACTHSPNPAAADARNVADAGRLPVPPLVLYDWSDDAPSGVLAAFTAETGVPVQLVVYTSQEDAVARLRAGALFDVAVIGNQYVKPLAVEGLLAPLALHEMPNFRNVMPSFRNLAFDPGNRYSVPYSWGTSGLIGSADLTLTTFDAWADLWNPEHCGRILIWWWQQRTVISGALKSLGFSANSEQPGELAAVRTRLKALRPCVQIVTAPRDIPRYLPPLLSGQLHLGVGSSHEAYMIRARGYPARYRLPEEGALLWGDSFVIPATSTQRGTAAQFIDFLLRPTIAAELANTNYFQVGNEAALPHIAPELLADPMIYPSTEMLRDAEILLPLSPAGEQAYMEIWAGFLKSPNP
jgi:spermidine/putrescine transport system substrate-binding protein